MIIFNCDDYGLTNLDVDEIDKCFPHKIVKSTTVVVNSRIKFKLIESDQISTGMHLNLVEGESLSGSTTLTDEKNLFLGKDKLIKKIVLRHIQKSDIENEVDHQIKKMLSLGFKISHIDTHQNMHLYPIILKSIINVASDYGVKKIRGQKFVSNWFGGKSSFKFFLKNQYLTYWNSLLPRSWATIDRIVLAAPGFGRKCESISDAVSLWDRALRLYYNKDLIYEVPCHLGINRLESALYRSELFLEILNKNNVEIGNYNDVEI